MQGPTENRQGEWVPWIIIIIITVIMLPFTGCVTSIHSFDNGIMTLIPLLPVRKKQLMENDIPKGLGCLRSSRNPVR